MVAEFFPSSSPRRSQGNSPFQASKLPGCLPNILYWSSQARCCSSLGWVWTNRDIWDFTSKTSHPGPTGPSSSPISDNEDEIECILREHLFQVSTSNYCAGVAMDLMKTFGSHLLIWTMLTSCSKHGRMKELHFSIVQDAIEMFLESIAIGFEPERFAINNASVKE